MCRRPRRSWSLIFRRAECGSVRRSIAAKVPQVAGMFAAAKYRVFLTKERNTYMKTKMKFALILSLALVGMSCGGGAATGGGAMANYQGRWLGQLSQNGINFSFSLDIGSSSLRDS